MKNKIFILILFFINLTLKPYASDDSYYFNYNINYESSKFELVKLFLKNFLEERFFGEKFEEYKFYNNIHCILCIDNNEKNKIIERFYKDRSIENFNEIFYNILSNIENKENKLFNQFNDENKHEISNYFCILNPSDDTLYKKVKPNINFFSQNTLLENLFNKEFLKKCKGPGNNQVSYDLLFQNIKYNNNKLDNFLLK